MDSSIKFLTRVYMSLSLSDSMTSPITPHTSQSSSARERSMHEIWPRPLLSISFKIYCSLITILFDAMWSEKLTEWLSKRGLGVKMDTLHTRRETRHANTIWAWNPHRKLPLFRRKGRLKLQSNWTLRKNVNVEWIKMLQNRCRKSSFYCSDNTTLG
jgi:hypothetical protein